LALTPVRGGLYACAALFNAGLDSDLDKNLRRETWNRGKILPE
jgi:hypothetical protein